MKYESRQLKMSDGNTNIFHSWLPGAEPELCVVISHGMAEYVRRYEGFARALCEKGIAVYGEDHRGHGETAVLAEKSGTGKLGYLADRKGFFRVADDIHEEVLLVRKENPGKKVVLFGHSFGSFITQCVMEKYGKDLDGAVVCGSAGPRQLLMESGKIVGRILRAVKGKKNFSRMYTNLMFGPYNARVENPQTDFDWLSNIGENVSAYCSDPMCGFDCTTGFLYDIMDGLSWIHRGANMKRIPEELPVLVISGNADPVGDYGKTVGKLAAIYRKNGMKNVELELYEGMRHELLNDKCAGEVTERVLGFLGKIKD